MRSTLALLACLLLAGCAADPAPGWSEAEAAAALGAGARRSAWVLPHPHFGPKPKGLQAGDAFTDLSAVRGDERWHVLLVAPAIYTRVSGRAAPAGATLVVIEVQRYPKDAVF